GQEELRAEVATLKKGQEELCTRVGNLEKGQEELRAEVATLKKGQEELCTRVGNLEKGQDELKAFIEQRTMEIGDQITETAEKTVQLVSAKVAEQLSGIQRVTADNCYEIKLLQHRA
ncbi:MAG: hypothetical protein HFG26_02910, partial [Provencibacterium sp.]|nr:hypothetical protein [Provencibacterium sp.]